MQLLVPATDRFKLSATYPIAVTLLGFRSLSHISITFLPENSALRSRHLVQLVCNAFVAFVLLVHALLIFVAIIPVGIDEMNEVILLFKTSTSPSTLTGFFSLIRQRLRDASNDDEELPIRAALLRLHAFIHSIVIALGNLFVLLYILLYPCYAQFSLFRKSASPPQPTLQPRRRSTGEDMQPLVMEGGKSEDSNRLLNGREGGEGGGGSEEEEEKDGGGEGTVRVPVQEDENVSDV